jgi:predicted metalloendopeptidase
LDTTVQVLNPGFLSRLNVIFSNAEPITLLAYSAATRFYLERDIPRKSPYLLDNRLHDAADLEKICLPQVISTFQVAFVRWYSAAYKEEVDASVYIVKNMFENLKSSFKKQVQNSERLSSDTKDGMISKLDAIKVIYGFPQTFLDDRFFEAFFRELSLSDEEDKSIAYGDTLRRNIPKWNFLRKFQAARFSDTFSVYNDVVGFNDWLTEPNAFYHPIFNSIVIQISTLTPPWFSTDYPASVYYGSLGYILGHEIGHAFDSGSIEESWLADEDRDEVIEEYRCLVKHYSNYTLYGEVNEGNKTLGENVADKIGIKMAHEAMSGIVNSTKLPGLSDLTGEQIFFIAAGQTWCSRFSVLAIKKILDDNRKGEPHTIDPIRVNAMMSQSPEFLKAFQCSADSRMNAKDKCNLWKREFP